MVRTCPHAGRFVAALLCAGRQFGLLVNFKDSRRNFEKKKWLGQHCLEFFRKVPRGHFRMEKYFAWPWAKQKERGGRSLCWQCLLAVQGTTTNSSCLQRMVGTSLFKFLHYVSRAPGAPTTARPEARNKKTLSIGLLTFAEPGAGSKYWVGLCPFF